MYIEGIIGNNFQVILFLCPTINFVFANSTDNDEMLHFICVFPGCISTCLGLFAKDNFLLSQI